MFPAKPTLKSGKFEECHARYPRVRKSIQVAGRNTRSVLQLIEGTYFPVSRDVYLEGKLPHLSKGLPRTAEEFYALPTRPAFFTNMLAIPDRYGTADFESEKAPAPRHRVVNGGNLIVTIEFDFDDPFFLRNSSRGCAV